MIVYEGPSKIDGSPIVCIATTNSKNRKTGNMIQTWIIRSDIHPQEAVTTAQDVSVCGDCPQRWSLGGGCYVIPAHGPGAVYRTYKVGKYARSENVAKVKKAIEKGYMVRLGAYGDPAAVPVQYWARFLHNVSSYVGYTHQWDKEWAQPYKRFCMASCDRVGEAKQASASGWRYFLATSEDISVQKTVECLADARDLQCADCKICDGIRRPWDTRANVFIRPHGVRKSSHVSLTVIGV